MEQQSQAVQLGVQLAASAAMVLMMTLVHGIGLLGIAKVLPTNRSRLEEREFDMRSLWLFSGIGLSLFAVHLVEIGIFAAFFLIVGAMGSLEEALYYSASAYATLGRTAEYFPDDWRLIGAIEALIGFVLISWSTAFIVNVMNNLRR